MLNKVAVQWIVKDVVNSVEFYTHKLGFTLEWLGEEPFFAIVSRDNFSVMFRQLKRESLPKPNRIPFIKSGWHSNKEEAWDAYIWVDNADILYTEFKDKRVSVIKEIQDTEYNNRDFEIEDLDGYILCFGHHL